MTIMALDIGERRIGLALSETGILATPYSVLQRKSKQEDFAHLQRLVIELKIERLVVGLPYSLRNGEIGPQARRVMRYVKEMLKVITVPMEYFDESYSTVEAKDYLIATGQKKIPLDAAAAAIILQKYLDKQNKVGWMIN